MPFYTTSVKLKRYGGGAELLTSEIDGGRERAKFSNPPKLQWTDIRLLIEHSEVSTTTGGTNFKATDATVDWPPTFNRIIVRFQLPPVAPISTYTMTRAGERASLLNSAPFNGKLGSLPKSCGIFYPCGQVW